MMLDPKSADIVDFPDEVQRILLSRLTNTPTFATYLTSLQHCLRHDLDVSPLIQWWDKNFRRVASANAEIDFKLFLEQIRFGDHSWEEEKAQRIAKHQEYLEKYYPENEGLNARLPTSNSLVEAMKEEIEAHKKLQAFAALNPKYRNATWVLHWLSVLEEAIGSTEPLDDIAEHFGRFFDVAQISPETQGQVSDGPLPLSDLKLALLNRPAWVVFGSVVHAHLCELADWIGKREKNQSRIVFEYLMSSPDSRKELTQTKLMAAVSDCSHALFAFLMTQELLDIEDPDVLIPLLKLPLAVDPDPRGPPHLAPEFDFISDCLMGSSGLECDFTRTQKVALIGLWKNFFARYRQLRINFNYGRTFENGDMLFQVAMATTWGHEECYEWEKWNCVEHSFSAMEVDLFCALNYFNERYFPNLTISFGELFDEDAVSFEESEYIVDAVRGFTNIMLPLTQQLVKEEWYKLACSLFAFYLVVAASVTKGNLDRCEGLPNILKLLRSLPGYRHIESAIDLVCKKALESGHLLTYSRFDQFRQTPDEVIQALISEVESESLEFKSTLRTNLVTGQADKRIEDAVLKTIAGFMNKRGGNLLVGVRDDKTVSGIEADGFANTDKWALHLKNLVYATMPSAMDNLSCKFARLEGRVVAWIACQSSEQPVYLKNRENKEDEFYVRRGVGTDRLGMKEAFEYIQRRFNR